MKSFQRILILSAVLSCIAVSMSNADLSKVFPRLITPGSPPGNERVFFLFQEYDEPKPTLGIFDITGQKVREISTLDPHMLPSGYWQLVWDGRDDNGALVAPGVYVYQWHEAMVTISGTIIVAR
jgi:hypothetical protein